MKNIFLKCRFIILMSTSFFCCLALNQTVFAQTNKVKIVKEAYSSVNAKGEFTNKLKENEGIVKGAQEFNYKVNIGLSEPYTADNLGALIFEDNMSPFLDVKSISRPALWTGPENGMIANIPYLIPGVQIPIPQAPSTKIQTLEIPDPMTFCDPADYKQLKWEKIELTNTPSNVTGVIYDIYDLDQCPLSITNAQTSCVKITSGNSTTPPIGQLGNPTALQNWVIPFSGGYQIPVNHKKFRIDIQFTLKSGVNSAWTPNFIMRVLHNTVNGFNNQFCAKTEVKTCPAPFIDNSVALKTSGYPAEYGPWNNAKLNDEVINNNRIITTGSASQQRYGDKNETQENFIKDVIPSDNPVKVAYRMGTNIKLNDDLIFSFEKPIYSLQMTINSQNAASNGPGESIGIEINDTRVPLNRISIDTSNQIDQSGQATATMKVSSDGLWVDTVPPIPSSDAIFGYTVLTYTSTTLIKKARVIYKSTEPLYGILVTFRFANYIYSDDIVGSTNLRLKAINEEYLYSDSAPETIGDFSYSAMYRKTDFSGELFKFKNNNLSKKEWDATSKFTEAKNRKIFTTAVLSSYGNPYTANPKSNISFINQFIYKDKIPDDGWKNFFSVGNVNLDSDVKNILDYSRGERQLELGIGTTTQANFRRRMVYQGSDTVALGDFVYSNPLYYDETIFVQGNDGMLHVFNSLTGEEQFSYIPQASLNKIPYLSRVDYQHQNLMTGQHAVGMIDNSPVLIGSTGSNPSTLFALNISSNQKNNPSMSLVKWDMGYDITDVHSNVFKSLGTDYLGEALGNIVTYGWLDSKDFNKSPFDPKNIKDKPIYLTLNNFEKTPVALLGNGLGSKKNTAALLVVNLRTGHTAALTTDLKPDVGLGSPTVTFDASFTPEYAYAGDSKGNLWRFKLSAANDLKNTNIEIHGKAEKIFEATKEYQSITSAPVVGNEVTFNGQQGRFVYFGSGKMINRFAPFDSQNPENKAIQSMRGLFIPNQDNIQTLKDSDLFKSKFTEENVDLSTTDQRRNPRLETKARKMQKTNITSLKGWVIELDASKSERVMQSPWIYKNKVLIFQTTLPYSDDCNNIGLDSFLMAVDLTTGAIPSLNAISEGVQGRLVKNISMSKLIDNTIFNSPATCKGGIKCTNDSYQNNAFKEDLKGSTLILQRSSWVQIK